MRVKMVQHAVGQGGLFCGELTMGAKPLRWIYDCGSNQPGELSREITAVAAGGNIDLLFLSHLDSDHICGIDKLLLAGNVREVVLPYLSETVLLASIARDSARGALTGTFIEAVGDLAGWFGSRGVETITFVNGSDEDDGGDGPILPGEPGGDGEGEIRTKWTPDSSKIDAHKTSVDDATAQATGRRAAMRQVAPGAAMLLTTPNALLNWAFIPYVHAPFARLIRAFDQALEDEFGTPLDKKALAQAAKDADVRDRLRTCYDALWLDHNLISMTLYAGPWKPEHFEMSFEPDHLDWWDQEVGGWMLTGDVHLDGQRRRQRFLKFYRSYTPLTNVLMLPHHGSVHNHSDLVLNAMPHLLVGYAAAGKNSYGHPHNDVRDAVEAHIRAQFHQVSEDRSTRLVVEVTSC
ncbi:hypothetical protein SAMN02990966_00169 [Rhodospirillales bacterium URHD0017]|nr:hypothetical protein SAMN02990966_00169 [Rhodospirillales bacterium URHD0017]